MKTSLFRLLACFALFGTVFGAAQTAAATTTVVRTIGVHYCWSTYTFGYPRGCNTRWPKANMPIEDTGIDTGRVTTRNGVQVGAFAFFNSRSTIVVTFPAPAAGVASVVYTGTLYAPDGPNCFRGTMYSDRISNPDMSGVWLGCMTP